MATRVGTALVVWFLATVCMVQAQDQRFLSTGFTRDTLDVRLPQPFALEPFILSGSERIYLDGTQLDSTAYRLDDRYGHLWLNQPVQDSSATLVAVYRTFPYPFQQAYYRRKFTPANPDSIFLGGIIEETQTVEPGFDLLGNSQLERSGSITRGIIAGNNRNLTLESGLRMQLSGEVTEGVSVQAVLTDENTPIQPDGTTQRLNEFDQVFIQIKAQEGTATLGDYDLRFQGSEFAPFNRKLQGVSLSGRVPDLGGRALGGGTVTVAGATSRGIFNTQQIVALEGVQGPYRLEGRQGEQFIIVIANSERVYLDGQLLTRGETNDYVIDYATGEITFTSRRIISEDSRVNVEFEYTTNRFTRTLLGSQAQVEFLQRREGPSRLRLSATVLREADSRAFGQEVGLSAEEEELLEQIGDRDEFAQSEELVPFDPEAAFVQYIKKDTLASEVPIYVPVTDTAGVRTVYRVRFTRVPPGTGSYRRVGRSVNGILFEWVGDGNGDYIPGRVLPKPRLQQMVDFNGVFEPVQGLEVFGEWAQSVVDLNRFSPVDDVDNNGPAGLGGLRLKPLTLGWGDREFGQLSGEVRRRYTGERFESFDRIRPIEFSRRWNLNRPLTSTGSPIDSGDEDVTEAYVQYDLTATTGLRADIGWLGLAGFKGSRWSVAGQAGQPGLPRLDYRLESITSEDAFQAESGTWWRQLGQISQPLLGGKVIPSFEVEQEDRRVQDLETGGLTRQSFEFVEWRPGLTLDLQNVQLTGTLERRFEQGWAEGVLQDRASSWTGQAGLVLRPHPNLNTEADFGYRVKHFTDYFRINQSENNTESVAVRWTGRFTPFQRLVNSNWFYEALTEKTPLLQETYVQTGPEIGQFVWEDANTDGIRQIDEFIPERLPNEGDYSRIYVPSDTLEPVINVQARLRLSLDPRRIFDDPEIGWQKALANVTTQTTLEVAEKSKEQILRRIYLLNLQYFDNDSTTVNGRYRVEQRVELFKGRTDYGAAFIYNQLESTARRAAGRESRTLGTWRFDGRLRLRQRYGLRLVAGLERNRSESIDEATNQVSASRTYDIRSRNLHPELSINFTRTIQLIAGFDYSQKTDRRPGQVEERSARVTKIPLKARFNRRNRLQVDLGLERADVVLNGEAIGLAAFELTDGRGPGTSYLWNLLGRYRFNNLVNASLSYDGRAPSDAPVIHTVRMQVGIVF